MKNVHRSPNCSEGNLKVSEHLMNKEFYMYIPSAPRSSLPHEYYVAFKGQEISEEFFLVFKYSKKPTIVFTDFCPKKCSKQKIRSLNYTT